MFAGKILSIVKKLVTRREFINLESETPTVYDFPLEVTI